MYRQASLRLLCVVCGVEQPIARMALAPHGGHWCWRCEMAAQVAEHESPRRRVMRFALFATVGVVGGVLIALFFVALGSLRLPCC
jgi:hypothetical protein